MICADLLCLVAVLGASTALYGLLVQTNGEQDEVVASVALSAPMWILSLRMLDRQRTLPDTPWATVKYLVPAVASVVVAAYILKSDRFSPWLLVILYLVGSVLFLWEREFIRRRLTRRRLAGNPAQRTLIVGTGTEAINLAHWAERSRGSGYEIAGFVGPDELGTRAGVTVLGPLDDTVELLRLTGSNVALFSIESLNPAVLNRLVSEVATAGYAIELSSSLDSLDAEEIAVKSTDNRIFLRIRTRGSRSADRHRLRLRMKRAQDLVLSITVLALSSPVLVAAIVATRLGSGAPVFYRQTRVGKDGVPFQILKIRTMRMEPIRQSASDPDLDSDRIVTVTRVGRVLRALSIDELPQLVNVIRGDMSMVGPRPALPPEAEEWDGAFRSVRLRVKPGLTGMWQVAGRADSSFETYRRLDLYYVDNWSLAHDLRILLRTLVTVFGRPRQ